MASGPVLILILILSIGFIILATARLKVHPFIVLITACFLVALAAGMPLDKIGETIGEGFGSILGNIGIVIVLGTIIGTILEKSGAAIKLADMVLKITGRKKPGTGIIGLPSGNIFALHHCRSVKNSPGILHGRAGNRFRTGGTLAARPGPGIITGENTGGNGSWRRSNDSEPCQLQLFFGW
ncbi:MAG: GntP family permease [Bacteroidales bacterium]|nr:GntP family permease [Bacteroidales bacterium]